MDIIRKEALPNEASIYTAKMTALREIYKRVQEMSDIHRLAELNAGHRVK